LLAFLVLAGFLIKDLFTKPAKESFNPKIYEQTLKPINFPQKQYPENTKDNNNNNNDTAIKYAKLWNLSDLYIDNSESCLKAYADQHPNNLVKKQNLTSLYEIKIGTEYWFELTSAFEKYASEVCFSISGSEMENVYANFAKEKLTEKELAELLKFFETELGKKYVATSKGFSNKLLEVASQKQRNANNKETEIYYKKIAEIQEKTHKNKQL
jgi:hypothetical protein